MLILKVKRTEKKENQKLTAVCQLLVVSYNPNDILLQRQSIRI